MLKNRTVQVSLKRSKQKFFLKQAVRLAVFSTYERFFPENRTKKQPMNDYHTPDHS